MINFDRVSITYPGHTVPTLRDVTFTINEGEFALLIGRTGVGKSTLLGAVNGLVPHFTGGDLYGTVSVAGLDTRTHAPRELAHIVGVVGQDPLAGFVTDTVEDELAYAMEQLNIPATAMRQRVEEILDLLGIADLRSRALRTLSGGQQQRVAIGSVLTAGTRILVLDEPTSALDPTSAEEVLSAILRLVHDLGVTALVAEHRMERVIEYADTVLYLPGGGDVEIGAPAMMMERTQIAPPVVELGRLANWQPLPLSVRDARRQAPQLRQQLTTVNPEQVARRRSDTSMQLPRLKSPADLTASGLVVSYGRMTAVRNIDLQLKGGTVTALMGRNGSGKSSLLWALTGVGVRQAGRCLVAGFETASVPKDKARSLVGLVPQSASDLLYLDTVAAECTTADRESEVADGTCRALLDLIAPQIPGDRHPRDLSEGQRLSLVLAIQLTASPPVLLLDEPTRGLDYRAKQVLGDILSALTTAGHAIVVATHDVEFAAAVADRVLVMATGELVADGTAGEILSATAAFAPQVAKILSPQSWLTVDQVAAGLKQSAQLHLSTPTGFAT